MSTTTSGVGAVSKISGNRFVDYGVSGQGRVTLSASFRGRGKAITGESRQVSTLEIDAVPDEQPAFCAPATHHMVEALFERWNAALATLDPYRVAACYSDDAVLLPTVSNVPRTNRDEIAEYFKHFLQKKPVGRVVQRNVKIGCNKVTDAGVYVFRIHDGNAVKDVLARYTFVYENRGGEWLIAHHHSSVMPE